MEFLENVDVTPEEQEYFKKKLEGLIEELQEESGETVHSMQDSKTEFPDPNDRASHEFERNTELRIRDRERKLIKKVRKALTRLENSEYNECEECSDYIGKKRLNARPVTNLCIACKEEQEQQERLRK